MVHDSLSREGTKVAFLEDGKKEPQDMFGDFKDLKNPPKHIGITGKAKWQLCGLVSVPWRAYKSSIWRLRVSEIPAKQIWKSLCDWFDQLLFLFFYANNQAKQKLDLMSLFENESNLREKNYISMKITMSNYGYWAPVQLTVSKFCF